MKTPRAWNLSSTEEVDTLLSELQSAEVVSSEHQQTGRYDMAAAGQATRLRNKAPTHARTVVLAALSPDVWVPRRRIVARTLLHESTVGVQLVELRQEGLVQRKPSEDDKAVLVYRLVKQA
jgi:hypothetical protein